jgi:hypothetical protein
LDDIADTNLKKLLSRLERGKIGGDGDDRWQRFAFVL